MTGGVNRLVRNGQIVEDLGGALRSGKHGLAVAPDLLKRLLDEDAWREFTTQRQELVKFTRFSDFVVTPPLKGIGVDVALIRRIVERDVAARDLLDSVLQNPSSIRAVDNIHSTDRPSGTSKDRALRRLRKDDPEIHAEVLAGNLSPHAAMVKAGHRPATITVRIDSTEKIAATLRRRLTPEQVADVILLLTRAPSTEGNHHV